MNSNLPKVLHRLAGTPLLEHVLRAARKLKPTKICVIYGHEGDQVTKALPGRDLCFVRQAKQLGTGHAVKQALPHLDASADTLILYGDVPLITLATLKKMVARRKDRLTLLTAKFPNPTGYGRIIRDSTGAVVGIVEEKDANDNQRKVQEGNTGLMYLPTQRLDTWLSRITNKNAQREYYLTDIVALAVKDKVPIQTITTDDLSEIQGINDQYSSRRSPQVRPKRGALMWSRCPDRRQLRVRRCRNVARRRNDRRQLCDSQRHHRTQYQNSALFIHRRCCNRRPLHSGPVRQTTPRYYPRGRSSHRKLR